MIAAVAIPPARPQRVKLLILTALLSLSLITGLGGTATTVSAQTAPSELAGSATTVAALTERPKICFEIAYWKYCI
jgi:hypothetical protein